MLKCIALLLLILLVQGFSEDQESYLKTTKLKDDLLSKETTGAKIKNEIEDHHDVNGNNYEVTAAQNSCTKSISDKRCPELDLNDIDLKYEKQEYPDLLNKRRFQATQKESGTESNFKFLIDPEINNDEAVELLVEGLESFL